MEQNQESCATQTKIRKHKPERAWVIDVDVYLYEVGPPAVFEIESFLPEVPNPPDSNPRIVFHNSGREQGFTVRFRLFDNTRGGEGSGYVFPDPPGPEHPSEPSKWALWSARGHDCPPSQHGAQWEEFTSFQVQDNGTTLLVHNSNKTCTEFAYTLRVTNDESRTFVELDPGGTNMNGSSKFRDWP